jgi:anthranilate synthase/aminodeoxychorismate synthase-like glutamine amidotransferase
MILVVDNYDSFTYNLVQYLGECGAEVEVYRNDKIDLEGIVARNPSGIVLSPGPCTPKESGVCINVSREALDPQGRLKGVPVFGVCLGHQALGEVSGGTVARAGKIMHGKTSMVRHDGKGVFEGVPSPFRAVRYHSLVVTRATLTQGFVISATSEDDGEVMGVRHKSLPIEGVQFHPESVLTEHGMRIVKNFARQCGVSLRA